MSNAQQAVAEGAALLEYVKQAGALPEGFADQFAGVSTEQAVAMLGLALGELTVNVTKVVTDLREQQARVQAEFTAALAGIRADLAKVQADVASLTLEVAPAAGRA